MKEIKTIKFDYNEGGFKLWKTGDRDHISISISNGTAKYEVYRYDEMIRGPKLTSCWSKIFDESLFIKLKAQIIDVLCVDDMDICDGDSLDVTLLFENGTDIENTIHTNLYEMNLGELADLLHEILDGVELPCIFNKLEDEEE